MDYALLKVLVSIVIAYLLGSIPSAVIVSKKVFGFDIREKGSGNMGSTNAMRVMGWKWGMLVQIIDVLKGLAAVLIAGWIVKDGINLGAYTWLQDTTLVKIIAGLFAVVGHIWSVFVKFKGGKGVNTAAGMLLGIIPIDVGIAVAVFLIVLVLSGYVSLGSILASITLPTSLFMRYNVCQDTIPGYHTIIFLLIALSILIIFTHRKNIIRIFQGTENKFKKVQIFKK